MTFLSFAKRFILFFVGVYVSLTIIDAPILKHIIISLSQKLLILFGVSPTVSNHTISLGNNAFTIVSSCTGIVSFSIFSALLYATTSLQTNKKLFYALASFPLFMLWNVLRIFLVLLTGEQWIHDSLWLISTLVIFLLYVSILKVENIRPI